MTDAELNSVGSDISISDLLDLQADKNSTHVFCRWEDSALTYGELRSRVIRLANGLAARDVRAGKRVAVMMSHHPDHIVLILALMRLGAILVPVNTHLRGASLEYQLSNCQPHMVVADERFADSIVPAIRTLDRPVHLVWRGASQPALNLLGRLSRFEQLLSSDNAPPDHRTRAGDIVAICYTSGTTGAPKGVLMTDAMLRAAATSSLILSGIKPGDAPLFWEPMYHVFGIEVVILALHCPVTLAMVERFSASHFWQWASESEATHIHYVGGMLQLLLKQPAGEGDRKHKVRIAWGGGCPQKVWRAFEERFDIEMRDSFGMTETAALNIVNTESIAGAIGRPLPYFEARVIREDGSETESDEIGQLLIRGTVPNIVTPGYFNNPEATAASLKDEWFHTGDLVRKDANGIFWFFDRKKDSIRRRGENISAWEVERVATEHPLVEECAVVMVRNEFDDEDLKIFVKPAADVFDPTEFHRWCQSRMARFQIPRFVALIDEFEKTPTERIRKKSLSRDIDCWDAEKGGVRTPLSR